MKIILTKIKCFFAGHDWVSLAIENIPATQGQLDRGVEGFYEYATMYCKSCGKVYRA